MTETILVVDDEPANRELLEAILVEEGYTVVQAEDGPQAIDATSLSPPDLVLLDLLMPGMNGLEVCERLKRAPRTAHIPIIVITAVRNVSAKEAALTRGADDFLTKPVQSAELRARVSAILKVRRIRQELDRTLAYLHELEVARRARRKETLSQIVEGGLDALAADAPTPMPVLLVDDDALTRQFYRDLLVEHGFQVREAASAEEGLRQVGVHDFDAAVVDIVMPGMGGLQLLEHLRTSHPDLSVIMLTGHVTSQNAIVALKLGAFDFIAKGLDPNLVVLAVHRAVRHRRELRARQREIEELRARVEGR